MIKLKIQHKPVVEILRHASILKPFRPNTSLNIDAVISTTSATQLHTRKTVVTFFERGSPPQPGPFPQFITCARFNPFAFFQFFNRFLVSCCRIDDWALGYLSKQCSAWFRLKQQQWGWGWRSCQTGKKIIALWGCNASKVLSSLIVNTVLVLGLCCYRVWSQRRHQVGFRTVLTNKVPWRARIATSNASRWVVARVWHGLYICLRCRSNCLLLFLLLHVWYRIESIIIILSLLLS